MATASLNLIVYPDEITVYQLPRDAVLSPELFKLPWYTISKTDDELSLTLPSNTPFRNYLSSSDEDAAKVREEQGWRLMKISGVLDFGLVGILAQVVNPLRGAKIPVFVISTFNTDYVLVKASNLDKARDTLTGSGLIITNSNESLLR